MKHILLLISCFMCLSFVHNIETEPQTVVISLGQNCAPVMHLKDFKLSSYSFPLDWVITAPESLIKLLTHNFKNFFAKENLLLQGVAFPGSLKIYEQEYQTTHVHDFSDNKTIEEQYEYVKTKYERRIERLYTILRSDNIVYLIRSDINKQQSSILSDILREKFPHLRFIIVAIGNMQEHKENWELFNVQNFYMHNWFKYPNHEEWGNIFKILGLITDPTAYVRQF